MNKWSLGKISCKWNNWCDNWNQWSAHINLPYSPIYRLYCSVILWEMYLCLINGLLHWTCCDPPLKGCVSLLSSPGVEPSRVQSAVISQTQMAVISVKTVRVLRGVRHGVSVSQRWWLLILHHLSAQPDMALLSAPTRLLICVSISHTGMRSHTQCPFLWLDETQR